MPLCGLLLATMVVAPQPAEAAPGDLTCVGAWTSPFSPAVRPEPAHVVAHLQVSLTQCIGTQVGVTGTSGTLYDTQEGEMSCTATGQVEGQGHIDWAGTPPNSSIQSTLLSLPGEDESLMLYEAEVITGPLAGDSIHAVLVGTEPWPLDCLDEDGLESLSGVAPVVFE